MPVFFFFFHVFERGENNNVKLLGLPEENDWILYAPWSDKSLLRNVLIYSLSNEMGRYAPRSKFVELYENSVLTEPKSYPTPISP